MDDKNDEYLLNFQYELHPVYNENFLTFLSNEQIVILLEYKFHCSSIFLDVNILLSFIQKDKLKWNICCFLIAAISVD